MKTQLLMRVTVTGVAVVFAINNNLPSRSGTMRDTQDHDIQSHLL